MTRLAEDADAAQFATRLRPNPSSALFASVGNASEKDIIVGYLELRRTFTDADVEKEWINRGIEIWP